MLINNVLSDITLN